MKTIKNVLIFVLLIAGSTTFAQQRSGNGWGAPGQRQGNPMVAQLSLSSEQQVELMKIKKDFHQKDSIATADFRLQREKISIERMKSFKSLLNKEQLDKMEDLQLMRADQAIFGTPGNNQKMQKQNPGEQGQRMQVPGSLMRGKDAMPCQRIGFQCRQQNFRSGQVSPKRLTPNERAQKQSAMMTKVLNLDEKQSAKIQEINLKYAQKVTANKKDKDTFKVLRDAKHKEIKSVLNKEQAEKFDKMLVKGRKNAKGPKANFQEQLLPEK